nr:ribonuclease H-like domain-containing protein [Tanacetum cinerariifolium]
MSNGSASTSNCRGKAKTTQPWTTAEEITLCTAWSSVITVSRTYLQSLDDGLYKLESRLRVKEEKNFEGNEVVNENVMEPDRSDAVVPPKEIDKMNRAKNRIENVSKHDQLVKLMQFLMVLNDVYQPIRSSLLTRETLPTVKDAFTIVSKEESHRGIPSSSTG